MHQALHCGLIVSALLLLTGCGGCGDPQSEMKARALKRPSDDENPAPAKPTPPKRDVATAPPGAHSSLPAPAPTSVSRVEPAPLNPAEDLSPELPLPAKPTDPLSPPERRQRTLLQMDRIGKAFEAYLAKNNTYPAPAIHGSAGNALLSWRVELLPYLGYAHIYKKFHLDEPWNSNHNLTLLPYIPAVYQSPERFDEKTNYLVPEGHNTVFTGRRGMMLSKVEDGAANTLLLLEVDDDYAVEWTKPSDYRSRPDLPTQGLGTLREDGFFVVWGGGLVGRLAADVPGKLFVAALTPDSGDGFKYTQINKSTDPEPVAAKYAAADPKVIGDPTTTPAPIPATPGNAGDSRPIAAAQILLDQANTALQEGRTSDALQWNLAASLADAKNGAWRKTWNWYDGLRRPSAAVHWGVGVAYVAPRDYSKSPDPVGGDKVRSGKGDEVGESQIVFYTGELGQRLLDRLKSHLADGQCGAVFQADVGDRTAIHDPRRRTNLKQPENKNQPRAIVPGLTALGQGSNSMLTQLARKEHVDVLVLFEVTVKPTRTGSVHNTTTIRIVDVDRGETLVSTQPLNNLQVERLRENPLAEDPVDAELQRLADYVRDSLSAAPMPSELEPEHARRRVEAIVAEAQERPLRTLAEVRLFNALGLISDVELLRAYQQVLGDELGRRLYEADPAEVATVLAKFLPLGDDSL